MTKVTLAGTEFRVDSASNIVTDTETLEFRLPADDEGELVIVVVQYGDYGSPEVSIAVFRELSLNIVEAVIKYARKRFGIFIDAGGVSQ
jgi:hypothetical protein